MGYGVISYDAFLMVSKEQSYSNDGDLLLQQSKEQMVRFLLGACNCTEQRWGFVPDETKMECFNGEVFVGSLQLMRAKWSFYGEHLFISSIQDRQLTTKRTL
ncbi:hypothetical protein L6452_38927 [Arctium lappa]|uniref:Uncharacterized protein n=1 Tax=Arctium lappa TaxID=4217 RepID=A0ACB8XSM1_ARCLA|nr:hypothetical protein L6452_38927 [Arctium lappa]